MAWIRAMGSPKAAVPMELLNAGIFQNGCTGSGFVVGSGVQTCPWTTQCVITLPEYVSGYTKLEFKCATTNATANDVLQATCAGHTGKATTGSGIKTVTVALNATDSFNKVFFDVVDRNGNVNQYLYDVTLLP